MTKSNRKISIVSLVLALVMLLNVLAFVAACKPDQKFFDNENDPLVFSSAELDGVFNPFFSTSAADSNVVGLTQIGMLGNDENGAPVWGKDEGVVVEDVEISNNGGVKDVNLQTTYKFVLKRDVKFSNGSYLSMKDVLFNLYVYLDPAYTGSSTIYSTDIVGLQEYRTQSANETEQDSFMIQFQVKAGARINTLLSVFNAIKDAHKNDVMPDAETFKQEVYAYVNKSDSYKNVGKDYDKAVELFYEELEQDFSNVTDTYKDQVFKDEAGILHKDLFTTDVEMFLYTEGYIHWSKKDGVLSYDQGKPEVDRLVALEKTDKEAAKREAIDFVFEAKIPSELDQIIQYWNTSNTLYEFITNEEMEIYANSNNTRAYPNISGIKFANRTEPVTVNGVTYEVPTYADDAKTQVVSSNEVLSITINNVDPKAIWNFAFTVAPMYYYSNAEQIAKFDYENNFGVEYMSQTFMNETVKASNKIGVPVGAGPYAASSASGGIDATKIGSGDFNNKGLVYFERNPHYVLGPAKIKKIRYQVVSSTQMLNSLYNNTIDFAEPNADPETITELRGKKDEGIGNKSVRTAGYGYIGINAGKVPNVYVRQAIMHAINTKECVGYYGTTAAEIHRPMSLSSWAYPGNTEGTVAPVSYYPYINGPIPADLTRVNPNYADFLIYELGNKYSAGETMSIEDQDKFIEYLVYTLGGYREGGDGIYAKGTDKLNYTFTIAGEETNHPAYAAMEHAAEILNRSGFQVIVRTNAQALSLLASGGLTVWAAAWGSTIDPDMYQVYHKDSKATSVLNWGYKQILQNNNGLYNYELALVEELSEIIEAARQVDDSTKEGKQARAMYYSQAMDIVMELAVELPTYQRDDLFAYNMNKIDTATFFQDPKPFKGLTSDIHTLSLVVEK